MCRLFNKNVLNGKKKEGLVCSAGIMDLEWNTVVAFPPTNERMI